MHRESLSSDFKQRTWYKSDNNFFFKKIQKKTPKINTKFPTTLLSQTTFDRNVSCDQPLEAKVPGLLFRLKLQHCFLQDWVIEGILPGVGLQALLPQQSPMTLLYWAGEKPWIVNLNTFEPQGHNL